MPEEIIKSKWVEVRKCSKCHSIGDILDNCCPECGACGDLNKWQYKEVNRNVYSKPKSWYQWVWWWIAKDEYFLLRVETKKDNKNEG